MQRDPESLRIALSVRLLLVDGLFCTRMSSTKFDLANVVEGPILRGGITSSPCTYPLQPCHQVFLH